MGPTRVFAAFTCRLLTEFPLSVAIETSDTATIISTTVVNIAVQCKWNCTTLRRNNGENSWTYNVHFSQNG